MTINKPKCLTRCRQVLLSLAVAISMIVPSSQAAPQNPPGQLTQGEAPQAQTKSNKDDQITLNFQDVDIRALVSTVSEITGKNFIVDPRVKGKVTLVSGGPLNSNQIYDVFLSVLEVHNFSAVPAGDITKIIPSNIVKQQPTPTQYSSIQESRDAQVTQVFQLKHASVQELIPILRPLLPPTSHFAAHAATNTLIFTDTQSNIRRLLDIIGKVDVPDRRSNVRVIYLEHASANDLASILTQIANSQQKPGDAKAAGSKVSIQADKATNSLIINAPDNEFNLLQAVIAQLDIERPTRGDVHVVYLRFAKAAELAQLLAQVLQSTQAGPDGTATTTTQVSVQADEAMNAIVVHAEEEEFRTVKEVIAKLDVRREQVFVETIIAEVSTSKATDLGVDWASQFNNTNGGQTTTSSGFLSDGPTGGLSVGFINKFLVDVTGSFVPDLSIVLHALRTDANTNILSTPNLLTLDNESAEIVVGQEVPFVTGQFTNTGASASTTSTSTDDSGATSTSTSVNPFQTIERKDVGIKLKITPQINDGDTIRLEIEQEISSVSSVQVNGASDLVTDRRSIKATVQVDDGNIVVLGGLIQDDLVDSVGSIPVLGKIPVLGAIFRRTRKDVRKTNLMIFLRPKIIRSTKQMTGLTKPRYEDIRRKESGSNPQSRLLIPEAKEPALPPINWDEKLQPVIKSKPELELDRNRVNIGHTEIEEDVFYREYDPFD